MKFGNLFARPIHPETAGLARYVQDLAGADDMARRSQIEIDRLGVITNYFFVVETVPRNDDYRFTYWGSRMTTLIGFDLTGKCLSDVDEPEVRASVHRTYDRVVETERPLFMRALYAWPGRKYVPIQRLLIPLAGDDGRLSAICGVSVPDIADADLEVFAGCGAARLVSEEELMLMAS